MTGKQDLWYDPIMLCPICTALQTSILKNDTGAVFHLCDNCGFIFRDPSERMTPEQERDRYLLHENTEEHVGYRRYLEQFIDTAVTPNIPSSAEILDLGSGPEPVLSRLLGSRGYRVTSYDPYFHPDEGYLTKKYQAVILLEVIEHMSDPQAEFERIRSIIRPDGMVIVRTELTDDLSPGAFGSWWYQFDATHISFFSRASLHELAARTGFTIRQFLGRNIIMCSPS